MLLSIDHMVYTVNFDTKTLVELYDTQEPLLPILSMHRVGADKSLVLARNRSLLVLDTTSLQSKS